VASPFFDVYIISLESANFHQYWHDIPIKTPFIQTLNKKPGWQLSVMWALVNIFKKIKPIYVHTHHIGPLIYGGMAAKLANIKNVIHTEHDAWHLADKKRKRLQSFALKLIDPVFVADANFVAKQVRMLMPNVDPIVITNGVDIDKFKPSLIGKNVLIKEANLPTNMRYIGCAARLESVKAHDILIKALSHLPDSVGLLLAGTGSLQSELVTLVKRLKLQERVFFFGHVENMNNFYALLDVFCLSSHNEGLPLSAIEAQACNVPVVLTDVGGCREAACNKTGIIVKPNSPSELSKAIYHCLKQDVSDSPREYVKKERSIKKMVRQYLSLINPDLRSKLC
jgi:glycosyltransferase involved in cell wall biosynthesis